MVIGRIINAVKTGERVLVSEDIRKERARVCGRCSEYKMGFCGKCKCYLSLKQSLATEKCPLGRWKDYVTN